MTATGDATRLVAGSVLKGAKLCRERCETVPVQDSRVQSPESVHSHQTEENSPESNERTLMNNKHTSMKNSLPSWYIQSILSSCITVLEYLGEVIKSKRPGPGQTALIHVMISRSGTVSFVRVHVELKRSGCLYTVK